MQKLTGVHVYEKRSVSDWTTLGLAVQLLSILSWKKRYGRIELYTNEAHLEDLRAHGIDKLYDKIDTSTLASVKVDTKKWWAFGKIQIAATLAPPFVILDTDLWITDFLKFDSTQAYQAYHQERLFPENPLSYYTDFDQLIPEKWLGRWDKSILPTNTAVAYINDADLAKEWLKCAHEITKTGDTVELPEEISHSAYITFIEQRLLPMLAVELGKPYSVLIEPIYKSLSHLTGGDEWEPHADTWDEATYAEFLKIIHIWGLKNSLDIPEIKDLVRAAIRQSFLRYPEASQFSELLNYWND